MRLLLLLLAVVASSLAQYDYTTEWAKREEPAEVTEDVGLERCTQRCVAYAGINPTYAQPCLASCNLNMGKKIEETLMRMTMKTEAKVPANYHALYRDGLMLQNQLYSLRKALKQQPTGVFGTLFPNLGFLNPAPGVPTPFQAPAAPPQFGGFLMQVAESVTTLLNQVIKRQQEILQLIIGCDCKNTTAAPTTAAPTQSTADTTTTTTTTTTTAAPVVAKLSIPFVPPVVVDAFSTVVDTVKPVLPHVPKAPVMA